LLQRAQDLANVTAYREWVLYGYLVCPDELLRVTSIDIAMVYIFFSFLLIISGQPGVGECCKETQFNLLLLALHPPEFSRRISLL